MLEVLEEKDQLIQLTKEAPQMIHSNYFCNECAQNPIRGRRYSCSTCLDYDLCSRCHDKTTHQHEFKVIDRELNNDRELMLKIKERMTKSSINYSSMTNSFLFKSRNL